MEKLNLFVCFCIANKWFSCPTEPFLYNEEILEEEIWVVFVTRMSTMRGTSLKGVYLDIWSFYSCRNHGICPISSENINIDRPLWMLSPFKFSYLKFRTPLITISRSKPDKNYSNLLLLQPYAKIMRNKIYPKKIWFNLYYNCVKLQGLQIFSVSLKRFLLDFF